MFVSDLILTQDLLYVNVNIRKVFFCYKGSAGNHKSSLSDMMYVIV